MTEVNTIKKSRKSYQQACYLANALDYVGERWIILIIRELLGGEARFNQLRRALPGIPSNLLADRLKQLKEDGLISQKTVGETDYYELTELGASIRTALEELGRWGLRLERLKPALHERSVRAISMALHSIIIRGGNGLPKTRQVIELHVEGEVIEIVLDRELPSVSASKAENPDVTASVSGQELSKPLYGDELSIDSFSNINGDSEVINTFISLVSF